MRAVLASLGLVFYVLLCLGLLFGWSPRFFVLNSHLPIEWSFHYVSATGLAFALFMISVAGMQSILPKFSLVLAIQVFLVGVLWAMLLYAYHFPAQSYYFAAAHLGLAGILTVRNLYQYNKMYKFADVD